MICCLMSEEQPPMKATARSEKRDARTRAEKCLATLRPLILLIIRDYGHSLAGLLTKFCQKSSLGRIENLNPKSY